MRQKYERLRVLIEEKCLLAGTNISLSAGAQSSFYFDCKKATLEGECLSLVVDAVLDMIDDLPEQPTAIGGLAMGADPIVAGVVARAYQLGRLPIHGSIVRRETKEHGTRSKIENQLPPGTKIVVVDDVITSGNSIRRACEEFLAGEYVIVGIIALVDRKAGGKESLGYEFGYVSTLFDKNDFPTLGSSHESTTAVEAA